MGKKGSKVWWRRKVDDSMLQIAFVNSNAFFFFGIGNRYFINKKVHHVHDDAQTVLETNTKKLQRNKNRM